MSINDEDRNLIIRAIEAARHQPKLIGGTWWLWDFDQGKYVDSKHIGSVEDSAELSAALKDIVDSLHTLESFMQNAPSRFLRKDVADSAAEPITFERGVVSSLIESKGYTAGISGRGYQLIEEEEGSRLTIDYLHIRRGVVQTPVKLWGQSFDGTKDVSGDLTGVGNLTASGLISAQSIKVGLATLTWNGTALVIDKPLLANSYAAGAVALSGGGVPLLTAWPSASGDYSTYALGGNLGIELKRRADYADAATATIRDRLSALEGRQLGTLTIKNSAGTAIHTYNPAVSSSVQLTAAAVGLGNVKNRTLYDRNINVNGTDYLFASSLDKLTSVTLYAPTKAGVSGQLLVSTGGTPSWANKKDIALSSFTDDVVSGKYLPLTGGTLSGFIVVDGNGDYGIKYNFHHNGNGGWARDVVAIAVDGEDKFNIGAHGLYTLGAEDNGIQYAYIGWYGWDSLDNLRFYPNGVRFGTSPLLHSSNFNQYAPTLTGAGASGTWGINISGTANSAKRLATAATFDGSNKIDLNSDLRGGGLFSSYHSVLSVVANNAPIGAKYGSVINFSTIGIRGNDESLSGQLAWDVNHAGTDTTRFMWWRAADESSGFAKAKWHQIAFTDSNVASATQLETPRKLWGQSFDGTKDVSGDLTGVGNLTASGLISAQSIKVGLATLTWNGTALVIDKPLLANSYAAGATKTA